jgi:hypothetical protein
MVGVKIVINGKITHRTKAFSVQDTDCLYGDIVRI